MRPSIRQKGDTIQVSSAEHMSMSSGLPMRAGTSQHSWHYNKPASWGAPHCVLVGFASKPERVECKESLIDFKDIIAKYTSTPEGLAKWQKAQREVDEELRRDMEQGRMSKVRFYRIMKKMDQKTLAKLTGLRQSNISRVEQVDYTADIKTYKLIAKALKIDYRELLP